LPQIRSHPQRYARLNPDPASLRLAPHPSVGLQLPKRTGLPFDVSHNNGNYNSIAGFMSSDGALHLNVITIIRGYEIRTHQEHDHASLFELSADTFTPCLSGFNIGISPRLD
jgi:hypothetical protein